MDLIISSFIPPKPLINKFAEYIEKSLPNIHKMIRNTKISFYDFECEKYLCTADEYLMHNDIEDLKSAGYLNEIKEFHYVLDFGHNSVSNHEVNFHKASENFLKSEIFKNVLQAIQNELTEYDIDLKREKNKFILLSPISLGRLPSTSLIEETSITQWWPDTEETKYFRKIYNHLLMTMHQIAEDEYINGIWIYGEDAGALPQKKDIVFVDGLREAYIKNDWESWFNQLLEIDQSVADYKNIFLTSTDKILHLKEAKFLNKWFKPNWKKVWTQVK